MAIFDRSLDLGPCVPRPDDDMIVCRCEAITKGEIRRAIHEGMYTMTELRRYLRAGMGLCQGNTCGRYGAGMMALALLVCASTVLIRQHVLLDIPAGILAAELGCRPAQLEDCTARGPARPVVVDTYGKEVFDRD